MQRLGYALIAAWITLASPLWAQTSPVVVELFTSQGCSSCPAADALLHELSEREDVIALALHVDYWDYIGWKDPFGDPDHAKRQRAYAASGGRHMIYTPEMVVQGQTDIVGAKPAKLAKAILAHAERPAKARVALSRKGEDLTIEAEALAADLTEMEVHLLRYRPLETTTVKRGENAGKTIHNANVVEDWQVLGAWDGKGPLQISARASGDRPVVVILQEKKSGPIVAAARLR